MLIQQTSTYAQATNQTDLLRNSVFRLSDMDREITGFYFYQDTGAATDTPGEVALYVSDVLVATMEASTNAPQGLQLFPVDADVPGGSEMRAIITSPPSGNSAGMVQVTIQVDEIMDDELDDF